MSGPKDRASQPAARGERVFVARSQVPMAPDAVFAWHARPGAFARLSPPFEPAEVVERAGTIRDGDEAVLRLRQGPVPVRWRARHEGYEEGRGFRDVQVEGPFARWEQWHRFEPDGRGGCVVEDEVRYRLPGGGLSDALAGGLVERRLMRVFAYRHAALASDLARHARFPGRALRVAIAGGSGLLGRALSALLATGGHEVIRLVRPGSRPPADAIGEARPWDPQAGALDPAALADVDAVVNLAGENVGEGRWNEARKRALRDSRLLTTSLLARTLAAMTARPRVLVNASAVGIYGDRGDQPLGDDAQPGEGWLAELARDWEAATSPAEQAGLRVVRARLGVVLTPQEGALAKMLPVFRAGLGGRLGSGAQWFSWIALDDAVAALHHVIMDETVAGGVNIVAPAPVTNARFTQALGQTLGRPSVLSVPSFGLRALFGEMANTMLGGVRVLPERLQATGFVFRYPDLDQALTWMLGKMALPAPRRDGRRTEVFFGESSAAVS